MYININYITSGKAYTNNKNIINIDKNNSYDKNKLIYYRKSYGFKLAHDTYLKSIINK